MTEECTHLERQECLKSRQKTDESLAVIAATSKIRAEQIQQMRGDMESVKDEMHDLRHELTKNMETGLAKIEESINLLNGGIMFNDVKYKEELDKLKSDITWGKAVAATIASIIALAVGWFSNK